MPRSPGKPAGVQVAWFLWPGLSEGFQQEPRGAGLPGAVFVGRILAAQCAFVQLCGVF